MRLLGSLILSLAVALVPQLVQPGPVNGSTVATASAATTVNIRAASFNIRGVHLDPKASGDALIWRKRRPYVVRDIMGQKLDVLGVQEANQSPIYASRLVRGNTQYRDLLHGLNDAGGTFAIVNGAVRDCTTDEGRCTYEYKGASRDVRILYNTTTLDLLDHGTVEYKAQTGPIGDRRYLVWATFASKVTGQRFLFTNTHLAAGEPAIARAQWNQMVNELDALNAGLPVVAVGDFQTSKWSQPAIDLMKTMRTRGYNDVLNQRPRTNQPLNVRAQSRRDAWINTMNKFKRDIRTYSLHKNRSLIAANIDWIFASNALPVPGWEVVAKVDVRRKRLVGVIPSDHFMVRATITLTNAVT